MPMDSVRSCARSSRPPAVSMTTGTPTTAPWPSSAGPPSWCIPPGSTATRSRRGPGSGPSRARHRGAHLLERSIALGPRLGGIAGGGGDEVEREAILAAEHAGEAALTGGDPLEDLASFGHPHA